MGNLLGLHIGSRVWGGRWLADTEAGALLAELALSETPGKHSASFPALREPASRGVAPSADATELLARGAPPSAGDALEMRNVGASQPCSLASLSNSISL